MRFLSPRGLHLRKLSVVWQVFVLWVASSVWKELQYTSTCTYNCINKYYYMYMYIHCKCIIILRMLWWWQDYNNKRTCIITLYSRDLSLSKTLEMEILRLTLFSDPQRAGHEGGTLSHCWSGQTINPRPPQ